MDPELWILRHAKAASEGPGGDSTRPLTGRGNRQAQAVRSYLEDLGPREPLPELVLCSPAVRALETAQGVMGAMPSAKLEIDGEIYTKDAEQLLDWLRELDPPESRVMLVGHNPTLLDLAGMLCEPESSGFLANGLPTAGLVVLSLSGSGGWADLLPGSARVVRHFFQGS
jgi:phosphohistidine phosphatase